MNYHVPLLQLQGISPDAKITWKTCSDMPVSWFRPQIVVGGGSVYVGGGVTEDKEMFTILKYDPSGDTWTRYISSLTVLYGLSYFQGTLITVGGMNIDGLTTSVWSYNRRERKWERKIPRMPTARCTTVVISTDSAVIVCGGALLDESQNPVPCRLVEVYSSETAQWQTSAPLPHPYAATSLTTINNHCFLVGEASEVEGGQEVTYAKMEKLVKLNADAEVCESSSEQTWKELVPSPMVGSAAVALNGALLTLGGDDKEGDPVNKVHTYVQKANSWTELQQGALPEARGGSSAAQLPDGRVIIVGGNGPDMHSQQHTATVFIGAVSSQPEERYT